jgi:TatD DNase family protein
MNATPALFVDSHCHIPMLSLGDTEDGVRSVLRQAAENGVGHFLCVAVDIESIPAVIRLAETHGNVFASVGIHPNTEPHLDATSEQLLQFARHPRVIAVGETGLDYYRSQGDLEWQRDRFRRHIAVARQCGKPLIIHTRDAREDTLRILREERAEEVGGVMHCFTEDLDTAVQAMQLGFLISFSGIVTFRNARELQAVARAVPADRLLVETDCPYLAPVPCRGKENQPAYVRHVGEFIATLRGVPAEVLARQTTDNFFRLFKAATRSEPAEA